jgi:hypothetical protein
MPRAHLGQGLLILVTCIAALLLVGCGSEQGEERRGAPHVGGRQSSSEPCEASVAVEDGARDARPWNSVRAAEPQPPWGDLRRFEISADQTGVCARWTTAAPARDGTELVLDAHGPLITFASGAVISHGHGFSLELKGDGGRVTFGLDRPGSEAPRVLRARVYRRGRSVSAFVPRAELDRPPANVPDRPPFPYRGFSFEARVITPPDEDGAQVVDFQPGPEVQGDHGLINGRLCRAPCARFLPKRP